MRVIYNILFPIFFLLSAPFYFLKMWRRGNWRWGFGHRFGRYSTKVKQAITNRHIVWLHAVSVGEVNLCTQLIAALEPRLPNVKLVVSTTTSTGMGELHRKLPTRFLKFYYPIDGYFIVRRAINTFCPEAVVLIEAEIWPNFLWALADRGIPVFLVNARLSPRSYRGYRLFRPLFRPLFRRFAGVGVQNEADAERLKALGFRPECIHVVGNLKFDAAKLEEIRPVDVPMMLRQLGVRDHAPVLVGGSTHEGEEAILAEAFQRLRARFPDLFLILVPRHFERGKQVGQQLADRGVKFVYRSEVTLTREFQPGSVECLLVNTTGELKYFYEHASLVFVGKSLTAEGGQNPIEPGALAKPMIFGPNMQNFAAIAAAFVQRDAAVQVRDAAGLDAALETLLADPARRSEIGRNALQVVRENQGAMERTVEMIVSQIEDKTLTYVPRRG